MNHLGITRMDKKSKTYQPLKKSYTFFIKNKNNFFKKVNNE